jgi:hypothetical protein
MQVQTIYIVLLPLQRPLYLCVFAARFCNLFGPSFAATHDKFIWPHLRLRALLLIGRQDGVVHKDWSALYFVPQGGIA